MRIGKTFSTAALAAAVILALAVPSVSIAEEKNKEPGDLALEGITALMQALEAFMDSIPQYEAPEVLPNGDIIIRRKNHPKDGTSKDGDEDATQL